MKARYKVLIFVVLTVGGAFGWLTRERTIRHPIEAAYAVTDPEFRASVGNLLGAPLVEGNRVVELLNGDRIFGSMLEAIRQARVSITLEMYIWSSGKVSDQFVEALAARARDGVRVHLIIDAVGSAKLKKEDRLKLTEAGAQLIRYNPPFSTRFFRFNHRTHRKLMVVDGRIGFIGGVCIADAWAGNAEPPQWRETHFRIEGPVVGQLQGAFVDNWLQMQSTVLHGGVYFPVIRPAGGMLAQCFKSGPREGAEIARLTYLLSFAAARKSIRIAHAYFVPDALIEDALLSARRRGVEVDVIFPRKIDNPAVRKASWARFGRLLEAGVRFWEYQPTLYHCKIVIVDDAWSIVGSVNFDQRSLRINDEANLNVLDRAFAAQLLRSFEDDRRQSRALKKEEFRKRNLLSRLSDHFAGLFRNQL